MSNTKQGASGRKNRKTGDWVNIAKGRQNRDREIVNRGDRDMPNMGDVGSAAYRRLMKKGGRH